MTWWYTILFLVPIRSVGHPRPASAFGVDCMTRSLRYRKSGIYYSPSTCDPSDRGTTHYRLGCDSTPHHYCTNQGNENMLTHTETSQPKHEVPPDCSYPFNTDNNCSSTPASPSHLQTVRSKWGEVMEIGPCWAGHPRPLRSSMQNTLEDWNCLEQTAFYAINLDILPFH
ncbi:hypothetical protein AVEN_243933-1 [Araneus ventricosus]|uniref:Uncharacterized protein n=1 Tax=Araneus ventricosus TaxID=182803 RepID=A0A4Y2TYI0_ARAVE|nr:hypothetical protein AVEN_243933-1 [Araneus ventricosus]